MDRYGAPTASAAQTAEVAARSADKQFIDAIASGAAAVACSTTTVPSTYGNGKTDPYENQPGNYSVANFRRIVVHGSTTPLEYLKLTIDPAANAANGTEAFGPFSWKRVKP